MLPTRICVRLSPATSAHLERKAQSYRLPYATVARLLLEQHAGEPLFDAEPPEVAPPVDAAPERAS